MKKTKDGAIDVNATLLDVASAIAKIGNPLIQKKVAGLFGLTGMLPAIRQGPDALKAEMADYGKSGAGFTTAESKEAEDVLRKAKAFGQDVGGVAHPAGVAAMSGASSELDAMRGALSQVQDTISIAEKVVPAGLSRLENSAVDLAHKGLDVATGAARTFAGAVLDFARRIEGQESHGRQFDRKGQPLTSAKGAIGAMQMLPKTAEQTAARHNIPWDPNLFRNDKAYNERLGAAHLQDLKDKYGGDEVLAAVEYNAGDVLTGPYKDSHGHAHEGWLKRFGDPRKGEISDADFAARIPYDETRKYVDNTVIKPGAADQGPARVQVEVSFKNAPPGMVAKVTSAKTVDAGATVARAMSGDGG
jgi:hypothetical protein